MKRFAPAGLLNLCAFLCICLGCSYGSPEEPALALQVGEPLSLPVTPDAPATLAFQLAAGDAVDLIADQVEVNLGFTLLNPEGQALLTMDNPVGTTGPETLCFVAEEAGRYLVRLESKAQEAKTNILLRHQRSATERDRLCHQATNAFLLAEDESPSMDDPEAGFLLYRRAAQLWESAGQPYEQAFALYALGEYAEDAVLEGAVAVAEEAFLDALDLLEVAQQPAFQTAVLDSLGHLRKQGGKWEEAEGVFQEALDLAREMQLPESEATALYSLGSLALSRHEVPAAVRWYRQALEKWQRLGDDWGRIVALQSLGASYNLMARAEDGRGYLEEALRRAEELEEPSLIAVSLLNLSTTRIQLARNQPETVAAKVAPDLERAAGIYRKLQEPRNEIVALNRLAGTQRRAGDLPAAMGTYRTSLSLSTKLGNQRYRAYTLVNLGCTFVEVDRPDEARPYLDEALAYFTDTSQEDMSQAHALACQARVLRAADELEPARDRFRRALAVVEEIRSRARKIGASLDPSFVWQDYAELAAGVSLELYARSGDEALVREAFEIRDLARARGLVERLRVPVSSTETGDPKLHEALASARARLNRAGERHRRLAAQGAPPQELKQGDNQITDLKLAVREAEEALRQREHPPAEAPDPQKAPPLPPAAASSLQAALDDETALLTYALGKEESWLFLLHRDSLQAHRLPPRAKIEGVARRYWEALRKPGSYPPPYRPSGQTLLDGQYLSSILLSPVLKGEGSAANSPTPLKRLVVVPEGMLAYLPFGVLPLPGSSVSDSEPSSVLGSYELAYLPSAASLGALRSRAISRRATGRTEAASASTFPPLPSALALVDAVYGPEDSRVGSQAASVAAASGSLEPWLPRLSYSHQDGDILEEILPPSRREVFRGFGAHRERLLSGDLPAANILHLGVHAEVDEDHPELSALFLSRLDPAGNPIPGALYLHEIAALSLEVDLAVLSGCRTALGRNVRGAALHGLARGFFLAGASRLVVSLWKVDDEATAQLMVHFYRALLQDSLPPAAALRQAQLQLSAEPRWQAPYYWAGFVLQGEWR